jgi:hypothetical protein
MALKDTWIDRVDGVDDVSSEDPNVIAHAVIELEEKIPEIKAGLQLILDAVNSLSGGEST